MESKARFFFFVAQMSCHQISRPGQIFGALSMSQVSVQKTSQRTREKRGKGMISNWEVLRKTKQ